MRASPADSTPPSSCSRWCVASRSFIQTSAREDRSTHRSAFVTRSGRGNNRSGLHASRPSRHHAGGLSAHPAGADAVSGDVALRRCAAVPRFPARLARTARVRLDREDQRRSRYSVCDRVAADRRHAGGGEESRTADRLRPGQHPRRRSRGQGCSAGTVARPGFFARAGCTRLHSPHRGPDLQRRRQ